MPSSERDKRLRAELAAELDWYPADLDDESIARQRADADQGGSAYQPGEHRSGVGSDLVNLQVDVSGLALLSYASGLLVFPCRAPEPHGPGDY
jgi:hypothetical protein